MDSNPPSPSSSTLKQQPFLRYVVNDLWEWNNNHNTWNKLETRNDESNRTRSGDMPVPRLVGAAAVVEEVVYLFGGWNSDDPNNMFLDTIHKLHLDTTNNQHDALRWKALATRIPGGPVSRHVAVALEETARNGGENNNHEHRGGKILVHTHRCQDYVWIFDTTTETFAKQPTTGPCPSSRGLHAACHVPTRGGGGVVMFGGASQDGTMSNQLFWLDTNTWEWQELSANDFTSSATEVKNAPSPRAGSCLCSIEGEKCVIMYGGAEATDGGLKPHGDVWLFDLENLGWTCLLPSTNHDAPPPRNAAALLALPHHPDKETGEQGTVSDFLMTTGWAPFRRTWDDCYILRVSKN